MRTLKLFAIAITAAALAAPAFAGPDSAQLAAQKRAYERVKAPKAFAGSTRPQGAVAPASGHPTERVRR